MAGINRKQNWTKTDKSFLLISDWLLFSWMIVFWLVFTLNFNYNFLVTAINTKQKSILVNFDQKQIFWQVVLFWHCAINDHFLFIVFYYSPPEDLIKLPLHVTTLSKRQTETICVRTRLLQSFHATWASLCVHQLRVRRCQIICNTRPDWQADHQVTTLD